MQVIISLSGDGLYYAIPQHDLGIGFFGSGRSIDDAKLDLQNSYEEARQLESGLPDSVTFQYYYDISCFIKYFSKRYSMGFLHTLTGIPLYKLEEYAKGKATPTEKFARKFIERVNNFKEEINEYELSQL